MNKREPISLPAGIVTEIPIDLIDRDEHQPRIEFEAGALERLAHDIKLRGIKKPLELRTAAKGRFVLEDGERRWRAAKVAGLATVPALLAGAHAGDDEGLERLLHQAAIALLTEQLTIIDKADLFRRLVDDYKIKVGELPDYLEQRGLGIYSRSYVSNIIRMHELPQWAKDAIAADRMPASAALSILSIADLAPAMATLAELVASFDEDDASDGRLTHREIDELIDDAMAEHYELADNGWASDAARYDIDEHAATIGLRTVAGAEGRRYITNAEAHRELNDQHPKPHPKSPAAKYPQRHGGPDKAVTTKKKGDESATKQPRTDLLEVRNIETIETYLVDWWRAYIATHHGRNPRIINAVVSWAACGAPRNFELSTMVDVNRFKDAQHDTCVEIKRESLGKFLAHDMDDDDRAALFDRLLATMGKDAIVDLVQHLELSVEAHYTIDADYLGLHTKATLEATVRKMGAGQLLDGSGKSPPDPAWTKACAKLSTMRIYCVEHAATWRADNRTPADLVKVWKGLTRARK